MFLKPGPQNPNEFTLVAPTGFEPVFAVRHTGRPEGVQGD